MKFIFTFFVCLLFGQITSAYGQFKISEKESIVVIAPKNSSNSDQRAIDYLENYSKEVVNALVQSGKKKGKKNIVFLHSASLAPDAFEIDVTTDELVITGGERNGCLYAVLHIFEHYAGCHFYSPDTRVFPKVTEIVVPKGKITQTPAFENRIINIYYPTNQEYLDWTRLQTIEEMYPEGYFVHTFSKFIERSTVGFEEQNFALIKGQRSKNQLCPSQLSTKKLIIDVLQKEMKKQPNKKTWSVSQNDNEFYCECDDCMRTIRKEGSPAGPIILLVNAIAEKFPDKIISTLAYQYSRKPTVTKPLDNVEIMLCTIELMRHEPIAQTKDDSFQQNIYGWHKLSKNLFLWDYTIDFDHSLAPFPNLSVLQPNIQFFQSYGVKSLFEQSNSTHGYEFAELKVHLLSKLMWNPNLDVNLETDRFLSAYYGKAGKNIKDYMNFLSTEVNRNHIPLWIYDNPSVHQNDLFSVKNTAKMQQLFKDALSSVEPNSLAHAHVEQLRLGLSYTLLEIATDQLIGPRGWFETNNGNTTLRQEMVKELQFFEKVCNEQQVATINESKLTPAEYINGLKRLINADFSNLAIPAKVTATTLPSTKYADGNLTLLHDGISGTTDFKNNWLGWEGTNTELTIELNQEQDLNTLSTSFYVQAKSWILAPENISVFYSKNGEQWSPLEQSAITYVPISQNGIIPFTAKLQKKDVKWVKIKIQGYEQLPASHPYGGNPGWFFMDDITIH